MSETQSLIESFKMHDSQIPPFALSLPVLSLPNGSKGFDKLSPNGLLS